MTTVNGLLRQGPRADDSAQQAAAERTLIGARGDPVAALGEAWRRRELLLFFVVRELKVRYRQTLLGVVWVVAQPLLAAAVFAVIFGRVVGIPSDGLPYPLFVFAGTSIWFFFSGGLTRATLSVVGNAGLLKKVHFPRIFVPLAPILTGLVDLAVTLGVLGVWACLTVGCTPMALLRLSVPVTLALMCAVGSGLWFSGIAARYRDVVLLAPFVTQIWLFLTPVVYPLSLVPEKWRWLMALNPMAGAAEGMRWAIQGGASPEHLVTAGVTATVLCLSGLVAYMRLARDFAEVL